MKTGVELEGYVRIAFCPSETWRAVLKRAEWLLCEDGEFTSFTADFKSFPVRSVTEWERWNIRWEDLRIRVFSKDMRLRSLYVLLPLKNWRLLTNVFTLLASSAVGWSTFGFGCFPGLGTGKRGTVPKIWRAVCKWCLSLITISTKHLTGCRDVGLPTRT